MSSGVLSTARPTGLRLAGFVCVVLGAVAAGVGSTRAWITVGFTADVEGAADLPVHGTDVWEGRVVLLAAAASLLVMLGMRLAGSASTRKVLAVLMMALGALSIALPVWDAAKARDRFGGVEGVERLARSIAIELGQTEEVVRELLTEQFERDLRVEIEPGLWLTAAGGAALVAGGVLGLLWARRGPAVEPSP